jgi:hypothetical protein
MRGDARHSLPLLPLSRLLLLIEGGAVRSGVSYFATPRAAAAKGGGWLGLMRMAD